MGAMCS
jgi:hypothetical protein